MKWSRQHSWFNWGTHWRSYLWTNKVSADGRRKANKWSISIYTGESPFALVPSPCTVTPVLTYAEVSDVRAKFVADPFMVPVDHTWYMFFEVMNALTQKGEIGVAVSDNGHTWSYRHIVLAEPFHLSYPYVFEWADDYYMLLGTEKQRSVGLYRAANFPDRWSLVRTLMSGGYYADCSIFRQRGQWWMFAEASVDGKCDTLRLYYANDLLGTWHEHPQSPVIQGNPHIARPAGRVLIFDDRVIRYTQDCFPGYGLRVRAFEIIELTTKSYTEKQVSEHPILCHGDEGSWNSAGMHHIDPHPISDNKWIACVDGHRKIYESDSEIAPR